MSRKATSKDGMGAAAIGLGWRVHSWWAVVAAVSGPSGSPVVVHREQITLIEDARVQEPYHAAAALVGGRFEDEDRLAEARTLIASVEKTALSAAEAAIGGLASQLGSVVATGVVGGNRRLGALPHILAGHGRLHEAERDLYERAIVEGATRAGIGVTTVPATGSLFADASQALGVELEPMLAALGKSIGTPWQKNYKEATVAALVALAEVAQ